MPVTENPWGPLSRYIAAHEITEIMVNGPAKVFVERQGRIVPVESAFATEAELLQLVRHLLTASGKTLSPQIPLLDTRLNDGSRLTLTLPPVTPVVCLTIRRATVRTWTLAELVQRDALPLQAGEFLREAVKSRLNILITGGTSCGKTTLL